MRLVKQVLFGVTICYTVSEQARDEPCDDLWCDVQSTSMSIEPTQAADDDDDDDDKPGDFNVPRNTL